MNKNKLTWPGRCGGFVALFGCHYNPWLRGLMAGKADTQKNMPPKWFVVVVVGYDGLGGVCDWLKLKLEFLVFRVIWWWYRVVFLFCQRSLATAVIIALESIYFHIDVLLFFLPFLLLPEFVHVLKIQ